MPGILLDTHAFYWLAAGNGMLSEETLQAILEGQEAHGLFVSPISAWEISVASQKPRIDCRPDLGSDPPELWFRKAVRTTGARIAPIHQRISLEAASVATMTKHKDPGDCFLIATARLRRIPIVTRDGPMRRIAKDNPGYLDIIVC